MTARLEAVLGDITAQHVDAIVNAANRSLLGGGGVDGAIHRAAGPALLEECRKVRRTTYPNGLPVGHAVATGAGSLPARWVIHTVGPNRHRGQTDPALLASCFETSLAEAVRVGARSVAFPAVSAGVYGWAADDVASIAAETVCRSAHLASLDLVRFVLFDDRLHGAFVAALGSLGGTEQTRPASR
ncbi:MAG TPA: O-acetyl-ADP-ribose deacetylase [Dermatophilaceae bacterium]|nr:O-acetyl-ADP-ribose deacetylase [Dermatophilaceae bacterium]